ncbi:MULTISPECIES: molybdate ABC transporter substrate-binding protein [Halanaerobium]|uniref:Molybdate transport system substrate-binding protein n=1 Tax=Halanaerobium kushneri TaxID=56779 RepID=A0A1N6Y5U5_9FIRM|nr:MULTISPECIES: molybdate ABC transporter substrate-binding protein [Halanaerobium]RCW52474.1 molybdate transport system substrate-binding protein [Halanaerobium sp. ST460_2HS_T2]SIR09950.1 molybdate transport system substrate-binding protein [Halanaerobium kushneri]
MAKKKIIILIILIIFILTTEVTAVSTFRIMAASSLQEPLNEIKDKFEAESRDYSLEINYAGSQMLFSQIKMGVDFDLFLSANYNYLNQLSRENIIAKETIFARNELIIIINSQNEKINNLEQLISSDYSLLLADRSVPVGDYTGKMIKNFLDSIADPKIRQKIKTDFNSSIVSREFDVKSVLNKVKLGAADAGIVYLSDYNDDQDLYRVKIPAKYNIEAKYYMGLSYNSTSGSEKVYNYILSNAAQKIFSKYNFKRVKTNE